MGAATILWTIGHSNRTLNAFLNLLRAHQIEAIANVRCFPGSRRYHLHHRLGMSELKPRLMHRKTDRKAQGAF